MSAPAEDGPTAFASPLRIAQRTIFSDVRFGAVASGPDIGPLRRDLHRRLCDAVAGLPPPLWHEALATFDRYGGAAGDFYTSFYVPIWSFLHWIPAASRSPLAAPVLDDGRSVQALGLFLHLWDDHLCDGQLPVNPLRLQVRTLAWQSFVAAAGRLRDRIAPASRAVETHVETYLSAIHGEAESADLDAYCARFERQIAIWTLAPRLLGEAAGGAPAASVLVDVITRFALAWRLIDDIQDVDRDLLAGVRSAVWHRLDAGGRAAWEACRAASRARGDLDAATWDDVSAAVLRPGCGPFLLQSADHGLMAAARAATAQGWHGMARELVESRPQAAFKFPTPPR
jgi:hypothetical protein